MSKEFTTAQIQHAVNILFGEPDQLAYHGQRARSNDRPIPPPTGLIPSWGLGPAVPGPLLDALTAQP